MNWLDKFIRGYRPASSPLPELKGQAAAAQRLGVTREHLNRVLRGHRQSRSLLRRYQALNQQEAA